ncbi:S-adenosyl-L-methionine-dependent methyltransferase [Lentithecium fluviatile CBS 122367]|uniref:S-adenosyl-L-methionine-dependent methyltransferase n=1 Tax=Lentithecium fluviatile CBS 122367 TaxID=1168545 RepID=A0A6G1ISG3_9PLEO|nr:S-adenosyl-L-methionine-dependent methyltransferase [Lentithecium fluviatile CBS 122367]
MPFKEHGEDMYSLSPSHPILSSRNANIFQPTYFALAQFLKASNYENTSDPKNTVVYQILGYKDKVLMDISMEKPEWAQAFGTLMSTWGERNALLQHLYPVQKGLVDGFDANVSPYSLLMLVEAMGRKRLRFERLSGAAGRGSGGYYIRQCLHDWPDDACIKILSMLRGAMKPGYLRLLLHELIVPEVGASLWVFVQDINMMTLAAVAERTEKKWAEFLELSGFSVRRVYYAVDGVSESVIEAVVRE